MPFKMRRGILREFGSAFDIVHRALDLFAVIAGFHLAFYYKFDHLNLDRPYQNALLVSVLSALLLFRGFHLYQSWRGLSLVQELRQVALAWASTFLLMAFIAFLLKRGDFYSREWALAWGLLTLSILVALRVILRTILRGLRRNGRNTRSVVIIGANSHAENVIRQLNDHPWAGLRIAGVFHGSRDTFNPDEMPGIPLLGNVADVADYVALHHIDQVWVCLPLSSEDQLRHLTHALRFSTTDIHYVPDIFGLNLLNHSIGEVAGIPVISLNVSPLTGCSRWVKALEDRLLAAIILVLISPLMLAIAIGVKLSSPGPVLFRQMRYGWAGEPIEVWKFRSMKTHAEKPGEVSQATRADPRVTPFGAFIRRTSLDELPQFINVLQGHMSIVGPRPHAIEHNEFFKNHIEQYMLRHKVKPGITGWAQVNGFRGETDTMEKMQRRVEYDLFYIENWSLLFDLKIIFLTIFSRAAYSNAY